MKAPTTVIPVEGMRCVGCALKIEKQLQTISGVEWVSVNFASKKVLVRGIAPAQELIQMIEILGYRASIDKVRSPELERARLKRQKFEALLAILFSIPVFLLSMGHVEGSASRWVQLAFTVPVLALGRQFYIGAWRSLKNRTATMDTLVAIGTGSAFITSCLGLYLKFSHLYFESAAVIISLVLLGRALEEAAKSRSSQALTDLMTLTPQIVTRILKKGDLELNSEIKISELVEGDRFLVKPGEIIATDGKVVEGISSVEESKLTGESAPKEKTVGSLVYGGTLNQNGRLVVEATSLGEQTRLSKLIRLVEEAQGSKTEIQRLADKISSLFVPAVLMVALLTFFGWKLTGHSWLEALLPSISVLVIACPCALGLATPTALITGIGRAAELGILIRDARSLELSHKVNVVLLDKTGTLTEGTPKVVQSYYCPTGKAELKFVSAIENQASHPFAKAISQYAKSFLGADSSKFKVEEFKNVPGMGCSGIIEGKRVLVGSRAWVESQGINTVVDWLPHGEIEKIKANGGSRVWASVDQHLTCLLVIHDELRQEARQAITELKKNSDVKILSGDNSEAVGRIAATLGITQWLSEVTPTQKADEVKRLKSEGLCVAMVGDGVNDGPALAMADVSFTLGSGTDLAKEVASMTLLHGDLRQVSLALRISHQVMKVIKQNLFAAFFYNVLSIPIAALGLLNPMVAGMAMALSSISVVLNSLRLKGLVGISISAKNASK